MSKHGNYPPKTITLSGRPDTPQKQSGKRHRFSHFDASNAVTSGLGCAAGGALIGTFLGGPIGGMVGSVVAGAGGIVLGGRGFDQAGELKKSDGK